MEQFDFLALPREMRDEIYGYFIPNYPIPHHLLTPTWSASEESDATEEDFEVSEESDATEEDFEVSEESDATEEDFEVSEESDATESLRSLATFRRNKDEVLETCRSFLLTSKHVHDEFVDALRRKASVDLYLYLENTPERPNGFVHDNKAFAGFKLRGAVKRLMVWGSWHNGEGWGGDQTDEELDTLKTDEHPKDDPRANDDSRTSESLGVFDDTGAGNESFDNLPSPNKPDTSKASSNLLASVRELLFTLPNVEGVYINLFARSTIDVPFLVAMLPYPGFHCATTTLNVPSRMFWRYTHS